MEKVRLFIDVSVTREIRKFVYEKIYNGGKSYVLQQER